MVLVRTRGEPAALLTDVARAVRRADPDLALFDVQTMNQRARLSWSKHSAQTTVFVLVAGIALALAVTGVYAVASYFVTSRMAEIGVRIALGASPARVVRASVTRTLQLGCAGAVVGVAGAAALSRLLRASLYETSALNPVVYGGALAILLCALFAASYLPVRRALRIDPVAVLRSE
jgi:putative ABC transport system permease protein